jgi:hypothetical protein
MLNVRVWYWETPSHRDTSLYRCQRSAAPRRESNTSILWVPVLRGESPALVSRNNVFVGDGRWNTNSRDVPDLHGRQAVCPVSVSRPSNCHVFQVACNHQENESALFYWSRLYLRVHLKSLDYRLLGPGRVGEVYASVGRALTQW